jgi:Lipase (class 3)
MDLINQYADLAFAAYKASDRAAIFYAQKGYKSTPIHSAESDRDEGYLLCRNGGLIIVLRGSDDIQDWCQTNLCLWRNWRHAHAGFAAAAKQLYARIRPAVAMFYEAEHELPTLPITVLGHSRGGAIGLHLAKQLNTDGWRTDLCTFGSPRAANLAWVESANFLHYRVAHVDDLVPHLPPEIMGYKHHGTPVLIGGPVPLMGENAWKAAKIATGNYRSVLATLKSDRWIKGHFAYSQVTGQ